jgi:hypothetical protein
MTQELTVGAIKALYENDTNSPVHNDPIVQIINIKPVAVQGGTRYR